MKKKTLSMAILSFVLISAMVNVESPDEIAYIDTSAEEAAQLLIRSQDVTILDVRTRAEYESGHIAGAISIPLAELEGRIDELDRDGAIIVYCKDGVRSQDASNILVNNGLENVYNVQGGLNAWKQFSTSAISFFCCECWDPTETPEYICTMLIHSWIPGYDTVLCKDYCYAMTYGSSTVIDTDCKCCTDGRCHECCTDADCGPGESCVGGICQSGVPEFPLGAEAAAGIGLMSAVVYIWLRKRKTKPTVAKRFTTKTPNLDSCCHVC